MPLRVLIIPDKFKGTLSAAKAAEAIARGWRKARPADHLSLLPMSDGGDGFGEVMGTLLGAKMKHAPTMDAAHRPVRGHWWWLKQKRTAVIDSAAIIGLAMLPEGRFHPFQLDSFGLGRIILAAQKTGATQAILGIGGSATNDGGFGLARSLGWEFYDSGSKRLNEWWELHRLTRVRPPRQALSMNLKVAVDVDNPLLGPHGCSRIYGPQKGLKPADMLLAEICLAQLGKVMRAFLGKDFAKAKGAGAAGGLGFGLLAFAGAKLESGFSVFARHAGLREKIAEADLVITGEGKIDHQTYMGKGVGKIAQCCLANRKKCMAIAGTILAPTESPRLFARTLALTDLTTLSHAQKYPARYISQLAWQLASETT